MVLYFAYGANMDTEQMARRCPGAIPLAKTRLANWRFLITTEGYASIAPKTGAQVHGVIWQLTLRDIAALNAYECLDSGLYVRRTLGLPYGGRVARALVYTAGTCREGRPRPGYHRVLIKAAQHWELPPGYVEMLRRLVPWRLFGARKPEAGELT